MSVIAWVRGCVRPHTAVRIGAALVGMLLSLGVPAQDVGSRGDKAPAAAIATPPRLRGIHSQIPDVGQPIASHYPQADSIGVALAIVPDPLVPRYRRLYDLDILALEFGMLKDGYLLDRYSFPWTEELRGTPAGSAGSGPFAGTGASGSYGLMVFRCDRWRQDACAYPSGTDGAKPSATTRLRALYIVTETATSGVSPHQLRCALAKIQAQSADPTASPPAPDASHPCPGDERPVAVRARAAATSPAPKAPAVRWLQSPACAVAPNKHVMVALGPNFSGSMDSLGGMVEARLPDPSRQLCLISAFATDASNTLAARDKYPGLSYTSLALDNGGKLGHLTRLVRKLGIQSPRDVAILAEASTFGYGICRHDQERLKDDDRALLCQSPRYSFAPDIADIAAGVQRQQAQQKDELADATRQVQDDHHLSLDSGAENGSEFPPSESTQLTSASSQLQLDHIMDALFHLAPKVVIVIATDVRDRLFLFDQLRERLPRAMLVDLEADNLLTHPSLMHSSRGALALASTNLDTEGDVFGCETQPDRDAARASWSLDGQGMLAESVSLLHEDDVLKSPPSCVGASGLASGERQGALQLVTFDGFKPVSYAFPEIHTRLATAAQAPLGWLLSAEYSACAFCIGLSCLWLWPWTLVLSGKTVHDRGIAPAERLGAAIAIVCSVAFAGCSLGLALEGSGSPSHALAYWVVGIELLAFVGVYRCYGQIRHASWAARHVVYSSASLAAVLAIAALGLCAFTIGVTKNVELLRPQIEPNLINRLGVDPGSGIAFYLVVAVATTILLSTSALLATRTWVVRRNLQLLLQASESFESFGFVDRAKGSERVEIQQSYKPLPMWIIVFVSSAMISAASAPGFLESLGGPRLTIFGPAAARIAVVALAATTLCACILLTAAYGAGRRIRALCGFVRSRLLDHSTLSSSGEIPGPWRGGMEMPFAFAPTPALAIDVSAGAFARRIWGGDKHSTKLPDTETTSQAWAKGLSAVLYEGTQSSQTRFALYALLVSELSLCRWIVSGAVLCPFIGITVVYLYPIEADTLLIINLFILALAGLLCAYLAVVFERDEVLSNVVCNRPKKAEFSVGLFSAIASPFVALAAAIALISIPGVVDWAGGLFVMLRSLGVHP